MALGNVDALYEWAEREEPGHRMCILVTWWITTEIAVRPWAAPSVPMLPLEGQATEVRIVVIPGTDVTVVYEHEHEADRVDLLWVGTEQGFQS